MPFLRGALFDGPRRYVNWEGFYVGGQAGYGGMRARFKPGLNDDLANQVVADVRQFMGRKVYDTVIPRNVRVSEAPSYGKPVLVYDLKCVGSEAYLRLATEIIQREKELRAS